MRGTVMTAAAAAVCLAAIAPSAALALEYRFTGFDAPRGAAATLNLRVPLGSQRQRATAGLTVG
ncbi:MAG: hypothetical protein ACT4OE_02435, partial [Sphingosinicella sp.]